MRVFRECLSVRACVCASFQDGMDDLRLYVLFNWVLVISGRWEVDIEKLCAMELRLRFQDGIWNLIVLIPYHCQMCFLFVSISE